MKANEVEYDGLFYRINPDDKTAVLSKSNSSNPLFRQEQMLLDFKIPSVMYCNNEEYTVIGIGDRAFMECHAFESVDLPTSIDFMALDAFFIVSRLKRSLFVEM